MFYTPNRNLALEASDIINLAITRPPSHATREDQISIKVNYRVNINFFLPYIGYLVLEARGDE